MKKLIYLIVVIVAFGLIVTGCIPVVPPSEQSELSILTRGIDIYVATTGSDTPGTSGDPYLTISYAISQASPGDTINVAAGEYTEQLLITKSLTIIGAGESTTIIKAPVTRITVTEGSTWDYIVAAYSTSGTIDVRIEGFTIDADSQTKTGGTVGLIGVFFRDVSGTGAGLYSCTIQNLSGNLHESWGVRVYGNSSLTIDDNMLTDYTRDGIVVNGDDGDVVISNNDLTGSSITFNGIQIAFGATGTIIGNTVRAHTRLSPAAVGIFAYKSNGITISSNTVQNSHTGICLQYSSNCEVLENEISDSLTGIMLVNNANNNEVCENEVTAADFQGIFLLAGSSGNKVEKNEISQVWWGIVLDGADDNKVLENEISDSLTGILLCRLAEGNQVRENGITADFEGIFIFGANGNFIKENQVSDSGSGIVLNDANDNEVLENEIASSSAAGISAWSSSGNLIKENKVSGSVWLDLFDDSAPEPLDNNWEDNEYDTKNWQAD